MRRRRLLALATIVALAACATIPPTSTPAEWASVVPVPAEADGTPPPYQRSFQLHYGDAPPPAGRHLRLDGAFLDPDRRAITVAFIGSRAYEWSNPCTEDYGAWATAVLGVLEVDVYELVHPARPTLGPQMGCTLVGYSYVFRLGLPEPFVGPKVRDRSTGFIWVPPPERVASVGAMPEGWRVVGIYSAEGVLSRQYAPSVVDEPPVERWMFLEQQFDGPGRPVTDPVGTIHVLGQAVPVGANGPNGWTASWRIGSDSVTLGVFGPDLTLEAFEALAVSVGVPGR